MTVNIQLAREAFQARWQNKFEQREAGRKKALQAIHAIVPTIVAKYPAITTAYIFGSVLRPGAFRADSDIDIAIEGGSAEDYFALWHELEDALPDWFIDLRDLPPDTHFSQRVLKTGEKIYG